MTTFLAVWAVGFVPALSLVYRLAEVGDCGDKHTFNVVCAIGWPFFVAYLVLLSLIDHAVELTPPVFRWIRKRFAKKEPGNGPTEW